MIKKLYGVLILEIILYIICLNLKINNFSLNKIWFSISLMFIGIYAIFLTFCYNHDSTLYYGVLLIFISVASAFRFINKYSFAMFYPVYIICFGIASFAIFVVFRQKIHFKLFAFFTLEGIILLGYKIKLLSLWSLVAVNLIFLTLVAINISQRIIKNLRRVK